MHGKTNHDKKTGTPEEKLGPPETVEETVLLRREEFEALKKESQKAAEYWERLLRQQADFENIRKRLEREKQEFQKFAHEGVIVDLLEILDDFGRSLDMVEKKQENFDAFVKGVEMIMAHLYEMLKKYGVKPIETEGRIFDPACHEALMQVESRDKPDHAIVEEMQKGYLLNDRVVRTAKVKVAIHKPESTVKIEEIETNK